MLRPASIINEFESEYIRFQLSLANAREVKAGLQRLCAHYDAGARLRDPQPLRVLVRAHLQPTSQIVVRRWAYKAIAKLGQRDDALTILQALKFESDLENQTWAMSAIIVLDQGRDVRGVCEEAGLESTLPLALASRLFANRRWLEQHPEPPIVKIESADDLTLKWASLLVGYDRAPMQMFDPRHPNVVLLGELNKHNASEVSEYSIWAMWQNAAFSPEHLKIANDCYHRCPENVRRWINRLLSKEPIYFEQNQDLFSDLSRDEGESAREGLALGLRQQIAPHLEKHVLDWHHSEGVNNINELLLEHMAFNSRQSEIYSELVESRFKNEGQHSGVRKRLLAACSGMPLFSTLKRLEVEEEVAKNSLPLFNTQIGTMIMNNTTTNTSFNAGGDIVGQNLVGGNMINSANAAIQNMPITRSEEKEVLNQLLALLQKDTKIKDSDRQEAVQAIERVAKENSKGSKKSLLEILYRLMGSGALLAETVHFAEKIAPTVQAWIQHIP